MSTVTLYINIRRPNTILTIYLNFLLLIIDLLPSFFMFSLGGYSVFVYILSLLFIHVSMFCLLLRESQYSKTLWNRHGVSVW